jgi:hypothetical protein
VLLSVTLHSWVAPSAEGGTDRQGKKKNARWNQTGLLQCSIRHSQINPGLGLNSQGGSREHPQSQTRMRPKLAGSCWSDTVMGKSFRKTGTERERQGEQHREVCFWLVLSRGFPPAGVSSRAPEAHGCTLLKLLLVWCSDILTLVKERCPFVQLPEMLWADVKGSYLQRPGLACEAADWLMGQQG